MNEQKQPQSLPNWLPLLILAITIALLFYRLLIGEVLFWGLPALQFTPWRVFAQSELGAGRLPLWNPYNGGGAPLIANYQSAIFYPPNLLTMPIPAAPQLIGWLGMLHLLLAGVGMWVFLGAIGCNRLGRGVGAIAFALNTAVVARFGTTPMVDVAAWLPWLMFGAVRIIHRPGLLNLATLALITAFLLLAGHAQWAFYSFVLTGFAALYLAFRERVGVRPLIFFGVALTLGAALAAIQLAPTAELQRQSQRSEGANEDFALNYSMETPLLITLFSPNFFGNPGDGSYQLNGVYFETAAYAGMLPLIVALATVLQYLRKLRGSSSDPLRRWIPFFLLAALIPILFAFGRNSALYLFLFRYAPTFSLFQAPVRWLLLSVFSVSALAGIGLTLWRVDRFYRMRGRLLVTAAVVVTGLALILRLASTTVVSSGLLELGIFLSATAILLLMQPRPDRPIWRAWAVAVLVFVAADLAWANRASNPTIDARFYESPSPALPTTAARTFTPETQLEDLQFGQLLQFKDYRVAGQRSIEYRAAGLPNMNIFEKINTFNTFEPLRPAGIEKFTRLLNDHPAPNLFQTAAIAKAGVPDAPRFWLVPTVIGSGDAIQSISDPSWNPYATAFLEGDAPTFRGQVQGAVTLTRETPQLLELQVQASDRAALILAETWYPGWRAAVNGETVPIYRANGAFRAVIIPAGAAQPVTVTLVYDPPVFKVGAVVSLIAALITLALVIAGLVATSRVGSSRQRR
jgi:hypothetical protein